MVGDVVEGSYTVENTNGSRSMELQDLLTKAVGKCPEAVVDFGGVEVNCLIDTGAEVTTITESYYKERFGNGLLDVVNISNFQQQMDFKYLMWDTLSLM